MFLIGSDDGFYWVLLAGICLTVVVVSSSKRYLNRTFTQFGGVPAHCGLTGALAARQLLGAADLSSVTVVRSNYINCYHPRQRQVRLRDHTFDGSSLATLAIAAHEVGHAQQFASGYWPARFRLRLPWIFLVLLLAMVGILALRAAFPQLVVFGTIVVILLLLISTVLTLEYDASRRARALVVKEGLLAPFEESSFIRLLNAAARTYLAWACQIALLILAVGTAIFWHTPERPANPGELAFVSEADADHPSDVEQAPPVSQPDPTIDLDRNFDLASLLLSSVSTLIPAVLLFFFIGKLTKKSKKQPNDTEIAVARNNAGLDLFRRGQLAEALETFSSALALDPRLHVAYLNRCHCYYRQNQIDQAMADVETALLLNPNFIDALAMRAQIWTHKGQHDRAFAELQRALELAPKSSLALTTRGNLFLAQSDLDKALADFKQAIVYSPENGAAYFGLATIAAMRGNMDAALADCSQALAYWTDGSAYNFRGRIWLQKREYERATADFTTAIKCDPKSAAHYCARGLAYYLKGVHELAIADQDKAIELDPLDALAYNNRAPLTSSSANSPPRPPIFKKPSNSNRTYQFPQAPGLDQGDMPACRVSRRSRRIGPRAARSTAGPGEPR